MIKLYASHLGDYMRRWILRTPWFTLRLHNILKSDEGRDFHDHPFSFVSLILRGGYMEHRPGCNGRRFVGWWLRGSADVPLCGCQRYYPGSVVRRRAEDLHRLELFGRPAWTLVVTGPYRRTWGFKTTAGWIPFTSYGRSYYK